MIRSHSRRSYPRDKHVPLRAINPVSIYSTKDKPKYRATAAQRKVIKKMHNRKSRYYYKHLEAIALD